MNEKTINNWLALSEYDINTAQAMLQTGRYLYVAFMCQQSDEKLLKAIIVIRKSVTPPYLHNLPRLCINAEINSLIPEEHNDFIIELNMYYLESRYSEDLQELSQEIDKTKAELIFSKTEKLIKWLKDNIL